MNKLFFTILLAANTFSQELSCEQLLLSEEDIVTGNKIRGSNSALIITKDSVTGFSIQMSLTPKSDVLIFNTKVYGGSACLDDDETISIVFTDTTRIQLTVNNSFNCDQTATIYFGGIFGDKTQQLNLLITKHIKLMRVSTPNGSVTEEFSKDKAERFRKTLHCLYQLSDINKE